jgi:hypothetical protein
LQTAILVKLIDKTFADQFVYHGTVGDGFDERLLPMNSTIGAIPSSPYFRSKIPVRLPVNSSEAGYTWA